MQLHERLGVNAVAIGRTEDIVRMPEQRANLLHLLDEHEAQKTPWVHHADINICSDRRFAFFLVDLDQATVLVREPGKSSPMVDGQKSDLYILTRSKFRCMPLEARQAVSETLMAAHEARQDAGHFLEAPALLAQIEKIEEESRKLHNRLRPTKPIQWLNGRILRGNKAPLPRRDASRFRPLAAG